jgi:hypothetical protein
VQIEVELLAVSTRTGLPSNKLRLRRPGTSSTTSSPAETSATWRQLQPGGCHLQIVREGQPLVGGLSRRMVTSTLLGRMETRHCSVTLTEAYRAQTQTGWLGSAFEWSIKGAKLVVLQQKSSPWCTIGMDISSSGSKRSRKQGLPTKDFTGMHPVHSLGQLHSSLISRVRRSLDFVVGNDYVS